MATPVESGALADFIAQLPDELKTDPEVFTKLIKNLDSQAVTIEAASYMREPGAGGFGGSPYAAALTHHTKLARDHVVTGVIDVSTLLRKFGEGLHKFKSDAESTDADTQAGLQQIQAGESAVSTALQDTTGTTGRNTLPPPSAYTVDPTSDPSGDGNG